MSNFISSDDYRPYITDRRKNQIIESDTLILDAVEETAIQVITDALYPKYDVAAIFATTGQDRPKQVLRWCVVLASYYIYERIPDAQMPDRIRQAYEEVIEILSEIADGKRSVQLPFAPKDDDTPKTKFRWGSQIKREHNI